jgi:ferrochelatase
MSRYLGESDYRHGAAESLGVLLVNLGTPEAATPDALRKYLGEFLWDPRVVEGPRWLWWLILHGLVLRLRPKRSAAAYRKVWREDGSPLMVFSVRQAAALQTSLNAELPGSVQVQLVMRYGHPSVASGLEALRRKGARRLLVLPLYPQYSATTTASVFDAVTEVLRRTRWIPEVRFINQYMDELDYIRAVADSIREAWESHGRGDRLMFSFHGIPKRNLLAGDPYHCQCQRTARRVAEALGLNKDQWVVAFQSRFGRAEWLKPYADKTLVELAKKGVKQIDVACPGFSADCLETLEEVAQQNREIFLAAGGTELSYINALNDRPDHIRMLTKLVKRHTQGWPEASAEWNAHQIAERGQQSRARALAMGAES